MLVEGNMSRVQKGLFLLIIVTYVILLAQPISLIVSDLGRHIRNGELLLTNPALLSTNFYSYTFTNYPVINHHWGSGLIFAIVKTISGFAGLSIFYIMLRVLSFLIFFHIAWRFGSLFVALLACVIVLPLMVSRSEIRPEGFSYLFSGLFFWLLLNASQKKISQRFLIGLPLLMLVWVNLHIYFFLGLVIIFIFLVEQVVIAMRKKDKIGRASCRERV